MELSRALRQTTILVMSVKDPLALAARWALLCFCTRMARVRPRLASARATRGVEGPEMSLVVVVA
jgi:hypothetical protein